MSVSPGAQRSAARNFASGVTVAAAAHAGLHHAITATAFCSLSLDPPLVLLAVRTRGTLLGLVRGSGCVGISVLGAHQVHVGEWAATPGRSPGRSLPPHVGRTRVTGAPLVDGAVAWFDCRVESLAEHGDHTLIVGLVEACGAEDSADPLLYARGAYHQLGARLGGRGGGGAVAGLDGGGGPRITGEDEPGR